MTHDIRRVTIDWAGNIHEVPMMFDKFGNPTDEVALASTCVVVLGDTHIPSDADDVPIYTVH